MIIWNYPPSVKPHYISLQISGDFHKSGLVCDFSIINSCCASRVLLTLIKVINQLAIKNETHRCLLFRPLESLYSSLRRRVKQWSKPWNPHIACYLFMTRDPTAASCLKMRLMAISDHRWGGFKVKEPTLNGTDVALAWRKLFPLFLSLLILLCFTAVSKIKPDSRLISQWDRALYPPKPMKKGSISWATAASVVQSTTLTAQNWMLTTKD